MTISISFPTAPTATVIARLTEVSPRRVSDRVFEAPRAMWELAATALDESVVELADGPEGLINALERAAEAIRAAL